jgi:hypothetical protein
MKGLYGELYREFIDFEGNGLYLLDKTYSHNYYNITEIEVTFSGSYIGRLAVGKAVNLKTSIPKEPTLCSTNTPGLRYRET